MFRLTHILIATVLITACAAPTQNSGVESTMETQSKRANISLSFEGNMPGLDGAGEWLNSKPLTRDELRGKVVLVQFWTYTCINWLRTAPYVRAWAEKYKDKGLVLIGVHTPEFEFEKNLDNVRRETRGLNIAFPVAVDNDYKIWSAFGNHYWPALYFVDAGGRIRHHHFGEGEYEQSERVIQQLLVEAGNDGINADLVTVEGHGVEAAADWRDLRSPENYVGYERTAEFASPGGAARDKPAEYASPSSLDLNGWALSGDWIISRSSVSLNKAGGRIVYRFHARDLNLVVGPATTGSAVRFRVTIDGRPPGSSHGADTDEQGYGTIGTQRLYQLVRQAKPIEDRTFEIEFLDAGVEAFAFTFG